MFNHMTNAEVLEALGEFVVGHETAKKALITVVNRSKLAYYQKHLDTTYTGDPISTSNCLLIGGSGTGKTYLVESLQKIVDFPLLRVDATQFSPSGSGQKFTPASLSKLVYANAKLLVEDPSSSYFSIEGTIDQTVVFIDEVDKLARSYDSSEGWHTQIQASLLSLIEDQTTLKQVTFIFAGAFSGIDLTESNPLGFTGEAKAEQRQITDIDIIEYGLIPELVGRISSINVLDEMTFDVMKEILINKLLPIKNIDLYYMGCEMMMLSEKESAEVINKALDSGQGVRALKRAVDILTLDREFNYETVVKPHQGLMIVGSEVYGH